MVRAGERVRGSGAGRGSGERGDISFFCLFEVGTWGAVSFFLSLILLPPNLFSQDIDAGRGCYPEIYITYYGLLEKGNKLSDR